MLDSCGIFMIGKDAQCKLVVGSYEELLNADLPRLRQNAGPGMGFGCYLPKAESAAVKLDAAVAAAGGTSSDPQLRLKMREKRLDVNVWLYRGENYGGSHFPLCVFTANPCRRSKEATSRRSRVYWDRVKSGAELRQRPAYPPPPAPPQWRTETPPSASTDDPEPDYVLMPEEEEELRGGSGTWRGPRESWYADTWNAGGGDRDSAVADTWGDSSRRWSWVEVVTWSGQPMGWDWTGWRSWSGWHDWTGWVDWSERPSWSG